MEIHTGSQNRRISRSAVMVLHLFIDQETEFEATESRYTSLFRTIFKNECFLSPVLRN